MATTLGSIIVELLAKTGSFDTDIKRSTKEAEKQLKQLKEEAQDLGVKAGLALTGAAAAATALVVHAINVGDEMSKMSQKVGMTTESLSALSFAAKLSDVDSAGLTTGLVKLTKNMSDAADGGGEAVKAFDALGIKVKNNDGTLRNSGEVLADIADKFAGYRDGAEKTALAVALFGKAGAEMIPLLNGGREGLESARQEAEAFGLILSTDVGKASEEFNDNLTRLSAATQGLAHRAAAELLPALVEISGVLVEQAKNQDNVTAKVNLMKIGLEALLAVFQTLIVLGSDVAFVFTSVGREIGAIFAQLDALDRFDVKGFHAISDAVKEDGRIARAELDKFQARVMGLGLANSNSKYVDPRLLGPVQSIATQTAGWRSAAPRLPGAPPTKGPDQDADFKAYLNNLEQQIQKVKELTAVEKLNDDIARGHLTVSKPQKDQLEVLAKLVDKHKEWADLMKYSRDRAIEEGEAVTKANEAFQDRLKTLLEATPTMQTEKLRSDLQFLMDEFNREGSELSKNPKLFHEAWEAAIARTGKSLEGFNLELTETQQLSMNMGEAGLRGLERMALEGDNLNDTFKNLATSIAHMIFQIGVMEPAMRLLRETLTGGVGGGTPPNPFAVGSGGGIDWGSLFGGGGSSSGGGGFWQSIGSSIGSFFGGSFASGGDMLPGRVYDVGEYGRERFIPRTAGTLLPNSALNREPDFKIINQTSGNVTGAKWDARQRAIILQEARQMIAADAGDPSSPLSQSLQRSTTVRPRRF